MNGFLILFLLFLSTFIIWKASDMIGNAGDHLAYYYKMPSIVKGAIVAAIASSFPELTTVILSTCRHGVFDLGVGTIVGSAVFNILIIPALSQLAIKKPLKASRDIVYKEGFYYIISVAAVMMVFFYAAVFYPSGEFSGSINRWLASVLILMYFGYLYIQAQEMKDGTHEIENFNPEMGLPCAWVKLVSGMIGVFVAVEIMIVAVLEIGELFNFPMIFWGITICAAATSIPDTLLSVRDAKQGEADAALANAFGSNTFDLLICIPVGVLIAGTAVININDVIQPMGFLIIVTFITVFLIRNNLNLTKGDSFVLLGMYILFIAWQYAGGI